MDFIIFMIIFKCTRGNRLSRLHQEHGLSKLEVVANGIAAEPLIVVVE